MGAMVFIFERFFFKYPKVPQPMAFLRKWQVPHPMETIEVEPSREIWSKTTAWAEMIKLVTILMEHQSFIVTYTVSLLYKLHSSHFKVNR